MFDEDKRYKIVICDDDETFIDLLSEKNRTGLCSEKDSMSYRKI